MVGEREDILTLPITIKAPSEHQRVLLELNIGVNFLLGHLAVRLVPRGEEDAIGPHPSPSPR